MKQLDYPIRLALVAATLLLGGAAASPVSAQGIGPSNFDAAVPCGAFQSSANGGWTAVAPVTLNINNGMSVSFAPGDSMAPGSTINGVAVPVIITRHCGNR
jgi:hypothetical protein